MAEVSGIAWTDASWNPWLGCHKVSAGCLHCYMEREMVRFGRIPNMVHRAAPSSFSNPLKWKKNRKLKPGSKIFTCSWSDWFIDEADPFRDEAWDIIRQTPEYTYLILTKRVRNISSRLPKDWGDGWKNVWLGITTENQKTFDERMPIFADIPATIRFLSIEPMLGPMVLEPYGDKIDWVITGGESDRTNAREMVQEWPGAIAYWCRYENIPFFHKQMGTFWAKKFGSRTWKGEDMEEWPWWLRVREFPNVDNAYKESSN